MCDPRGLAVAMIVVSLGCATGRRGISQSCDSDHDCAYGLVCDGAAFGEAGPRRCLLQKYESCSQNDDCAPGRICRNDTCSVQCLRDADCLPLSYIRGEDDPDAGTLRESDYSCAVGECRTRTNDRGCRNNIDCSPGEVCSDGSCREHPAVHCQSNTDCSVGRKCIARSCL